MNCTRAKSDIALWTGGDLDERDTAQLERHVTVCPDCREYRQRMTESLHVLHKPAVTVPSDLHDSVWPGVESRLAMQSQRDLRRAERLDRWLPAAAVAAACLAVIAFTSEPERPSLDMFGEALPSNLTAGEVLVHPGTLVNGEASRSPTDETPLNPMSPPSSWKLWSRNGYDQQAPIGLQHYAGQRHPPSESP